MNVIPTGSVSGSSRQKKVSFCTADSQTGVESDAVAGSNFDTIDAKRKERRQTREAVTSR